MRARVGDLAIARFDPCEKDIKEGNKWDEHVCIMTGTCTYGTGGPRYSEFISWNRGTNKDDIVTDSLPPHRLVRVCPYIGSWDGELSSLTIDNVVPVV